MNTRVALGLTGFSGLSLKRSLCKESGNFWRGPQLSTLYSTIAMAARATSCPPAVHPAAASEAAPSSSAGIDSNITTANGNAVAAVRTLNLPILQAESPRALAVRAEQLPEKASAVLQALAEQSRVRGINLMSGRNIIWGRMVNHEAALGPL
jgi:hypothetical protein